MIPRGFTLVELLITLAIAAILATVAVPAFSTFLARQQLASDVNEMISVLSFARSEAIKQREAVSVAITSNDGPWEMDVVRNGETLRQAQGRRDDINVKENDISFEFNSLGAADDCPCEFKVGHSSPAIEERTIEISRAGGIRREKPGDE